MKLSHALVFTLACLTACLDSGPTTIDDAVARRGLDEALTSAQLAALDVRAMSERIAVGNRVELTLPGSGRSELVIRSVASMVPGVTTFSGHLAGDERSDFTFSIEAGKLVGAIHQGPDAWIVEPHPTSDQHLVRVIDRTRLPRTEEDHPQTVQRDAIGSNPATPAVVSADNGMGNVRVLVLHASNVANASAHASNIVAAFNNSLALSAVSSNNQLTLAGVQQVASTFAGLNRLAIRQLMLDRAAPFTGIDAAMSTAAADIAFLLVTEDPSVSDVAGFGRVGGIARIFEQANPFALSTVTYALGDLTALHEIGHVFGGRHENDGTSIARGLVAANDTWMTVMGGYIECPFVGLPASCVRLNRWSNPDQTWNGVPLGVAGQRDMESHLESAMPIVSGWRPEGTQIAVMQSPAPGATLPGASATFSWSAGVGVSQYYLYAGSSIGGSNYYAASQGTATSGTVTNLPTNGSTVYIRLWSYTSAGWQYNDYAYTASTAGTPAVIYSPAPGSTLAGSSATFAWTTGSGVSQYYLYVGSQLGYTDYYVASQGLATSRTVSGLPTDGRMIYVRLWSLINGTWQFRDYSYRAATTCSPLAGQHGQMWTSVSALANWVYRDGWCSVGHGLPAQCWEGTYYFYQTLQSSWCVQGGSTGSCYDHDAWWHVTCDALVDCIYDCSGTCVKADC